MNCSSEAALISLGRKIGKSLEAPVVIELIGDVGAGKTTFTRGLAEGLGVEPPVTSPSFTISKRYAFAKEGKKTEQTLDQTLDQTLAHYDFYRLPDPGLMSDDVFESMTDENTITVIEWGESIKNLLPENTRTFQIKINDDGSRTVEEVAKTADKTKEPENPADKEPK